MRDGSDDVSSLDEINPRQSLRDRLWGEQQNLGFDVAFALGWFGAVTLLFLVILDVRVWVYAGVLFAGVPVYVLAVLLKDERVRLVIDQ